MSNDLDKLRTGQNPVGELQKLVQEIQQQKEEIDIPSKSDLNTRRINLQEEPEGNVHINGNWVHPLYARLNNMMCDGQSPIIIIVGKEGLGKSMTALNLLHYMHDKLNLLEGEFDPSHQTVYRVLEFLMLERDSTRTGVMFDEANETLNSNDYHSAMNKAVAGALRTQRKRENCHVFVCPEFKELDPRIRNKVDLLIDMKGKQYAHVRSYRKKHGKRGNRGLDYNYISYPAWKIPDVPKSLMNTYEEIDNQFKGGYLDELLVKVINEKIEEIEESQTARL